MTPVDEPDTAGIEGVGAWRNHDDPRDEWPTAADWTLEGIAGFLADAEDEFWTEYHEAYERSAGSFDEAAVGTAYEAMARRILTGPELADRDRARDRELGERIAAARAEGAQAVVDAVEKIAGGWPHDYQKAARRAAAAIARAESERARQRTGTGGE